MGLRNMMLRGAIPECVPRMPELESIQKVVHVAERYVDGRGCTLGNNARKRDSYPMGTSNGYKPDG